MKINENWKSATVLGRKCQVSFCWYSPWQSACLIKQDSLLKAKKNTSQKGSRWVTPLKLGDRLVKLSFVVDVVDVDIWRLCLGNEIPSGFGSLPFWVCRNFAKENQKLEAFQQIQIRFNFKPKEALVRSNWNRLVRNEIMGKKVSQNNLLHKQLEWICMHPKPYQY